MPRTAGDGLASGAAGFAARDVHVIDVADLTHRGVALS